MIYYTYILLTSKKNYYYGHTGDLKKRLLKHRRGEVRYTKNYLPVRLAYFEKFKSRGEAIKRDRYFKSLKSKKYIKELIERGKTKN